MIQKKYFLKTRTPAKLILSGEHAIVYGHSALAVAINYYTNVIIHWSTSLHFSFNFVNIGFKRSVALQTLRKLKRTLKDKYKKYRSKHLNIQEVLKESSELLLFTFINVLDNLKSISLPFGIDIIIDSNIPIGYGIGSSAASIMGLIHALTHFLDANFDLEKCFTLGMESENLQHGYSSGLDLHTVYHGGSFLYEKGQFKKRLIKNFSMQLVQTGKPKSSTGACVSQVSSYFKKSHIGDDFSAVTNEFDQALQKGNYEKVKNCIQKNHQLLKTIGVVPDKVDRFIIDIEKTGGAAKICGAGSVKGDNGGIILVVSDASINNLIEQYRYTIMPIQIDSQGTHIV
ncbi:mevalonate kinase [Coxiella endosymbiont of Amblyomma americanum]|uniref:mevalonate kinase n=1 Tax=Coxiella endosymbiont of Amblyomma americanum TaxID=325775 RepID=UPI00057CA442|nr:mevalonate kinase [Coxiella endosymbiont of Amblyomma americanum]AJC50306.1 mevalonate kinase [Coxiella endosymbiont of Amblyomma americanum]AUJ58656.1 mevalonate kinase [Coxiella-like endosymbiont of Amblyomma americanum]